MPQHDGQNREGRQCQQHAGKPEQLAERQQGEDDGQRMQTYAFAYQVGRQERAFYHLAYAINGRHRDQPVKALKLEKAGNQRQRKSQAESDIGNENQQAGEDADRQRNVETGKGEACRIIDGKDQHDQQLAAQVLREQVVGFGADLDCLGQPAAWNDVDRPGQQAMPVQQQVKQHDGDEEQGRQPCQHRRAAYAYRCEQGIPDLVAAGAEIFGRQFAQGGAVELDIDAQFRQMRCQYLLHAHDEIGDSFLQQRNLLLQYRDHAQDQHQQY